MAASHLPDAGSAPLRAQAPFWRGLLMLGLYLAVVYHDVAWGIVRPPVAAGDAPTGDFGHWLWNLWWSAQVLAGRVAGSMYFSPLLYAPAGADLVLHSYSPLDGLLAAPFIWHDATPVGLVRAYNWIVLVHAGVLGLGVYVLTWRAVASALGALAAAVYALQFPYYQVTFSQLGTTGMCWVPWVILVMLAARGARVRARPWALLAGAVVALQGYAYPEYLLHLCVCVAGLWAVSLWRPAAGLTRRDILGRMVLILATAVVLLVPAWLSIVRAGSSGPLEPVPQGQVPLLSTDVLSLFVPSSRHVFLGWVAPDLKWRADAFILSNDSWLGWAGLALMGLAVWARRGPSRGWAGCWALLYVCFALGPIIQVGRHAFPAIPAPFRVLAAVIPGYALQRSPDRLMGMANPFLAVLVGGGVAALTARLRAAHRPLAFAALPVFLVALEGWRAPPRAAAPFRLPAAYAALAERPRGILVALPRWSWAMEGAHTAYQSQTGFPFAGGAVSRLPAGRRAIPDDVGPVRYVALQRSFYGAVPGAYAEAEARLDALGHVLADDGDVRLYELPEPGLTVGHIPRVGYVPNPWPDDAHAQERLRAARDG